MIPRVARSGESREVVKLGAGVANVDRGVRGRAGRLGGEHRVHGEEREAREEEHREARHRAVRAILSANDIRDLSLFAESGIIL